MLGNCQATGIAQSLRLTLPDARVEAIYVAYLTKNFGDLDGLAAHLGGFDHVFAHFFPEGFVRGGDVHTLVARLPHLRLFPTIAFPAFHPDMVYVGDVAGLRLSTLIDGPLGPSHSAIALCGYLEGLSVEATLALFTDAVFERLGYYALWEEGSAYLLRIAAQMRFGLERELSLWARGGCFMHDVSHPKMHVLGDVARRLATEAGLAPLDVRVEDYLPDALLDEAMWPVHPAIAERYGVAPGSLFRSRPREGRPPALLDLPGFVAASFALYDRHPREALVSARVEAWRADPEIRALFASAGGS